MWRPQVNDKLNWASAMDKYVDYLAKVEGFTGKDSQGCRMARLSVGSETITNFTFRVRDLELVPDSSSYDTLQGDSRIEVGSEVIVHKHRAVCLSVFVSVFLLMLFTCVCSGQGQRQLGKRHGQLRWHAGHSNAFHRR